MLVQVFDLLYTDPDQVREFLLAMAKEGFVGGVYLWINRLNGKTYVGSSVNMYSRIKGYLSLNKLHGIIGKGLRKYGTNGFVILIILFPNATRPSVLALEQLILDNWYCAYNILPTAGSSAGVKWSPEHKAKISESLKGNQNNLGRKATEETLAKMSSAQSGENNPRFNKGKEVHLIQFLPSGLKHIASFPNRSRCAEALGVSRPTIERRLKKKSSFFYNGSEHMVTYELPSNLS